MNGKPAGELLLLITVTELFLDQLQDLDKLKQKSVGWLKIHVKQATDLMAGDSNGLSDPFVTVVLGNSRLKVGLLFYFLLNFALFLGCMHVWENNKLNL